MITPTLRLLRPLGAGGMGAVWAADHLGLRTEVVVKFMAPELATNQIAVERFSREAAAASQVKSPHVVQMIDYGVSPTGLPYIVMELLEGKDLGRVIAQYGTLAPEGVLRIVTQVSRALMRAQEKKLVHRDIKPDNIFLIDAGGGEVFAKVLDFGIAKAALEEMTRSTGTGVMVGTPLYMSPEQILGQQIDHRSDLWSLGVVAFEALTGSLPFNGETVGAISVAICSGPIPRPSAANPTLGPAIDAWFQQACSREPATRFMSAKAMADALAHAIASDEHAERFEGSATEMAAASMEAALPAGVPEMHPTTTTWDGEEQTTVQHRANLLDPLDYDETRALPRVTTNGASVVAPLAPQVVAAPMKSRRFALVAAVVAALSVGGVAIAFVSLSSRPADDDQPHRPRRTHPARSAAPSAEEVPPEASTPPPGVSETASALPSVTAAPSASVTPTAVASLPAPAPHPPVPTASASAPAKPKKKGSYVIE